LIRAWEVESHHHCPHPRHAILLRLVVFTSLRDSLRRRSSEVRAKSKTCSFSLLEGLVALEVEVRQLCAVVLIVFIVVLPVAMSAQQTQPTSTPPAVRDAQALGLLQQALSSAGVTSLAAQVQDFTETGTITYFWAGQEVSGSVTLRGLGMNDFRLDAALASENQSLSWAVSDSQGSVKQANGKTTVIPSCNATNAGVLTLPHLGILTAINDATVSVSPATQVTLNERPTYDIRLQKTFTQQADPTGELTKCNTKDYLVDAATFALIETRDTVYPNDAPIAGIPHEVIFSGYQPMNGVAVPFSVTEKLDGQETWAIQLSAVNFNTGLTSAIFQF
jgi:hypothetical protein